MAALQSPYALLEPPPKPPEASRPFLPDEAGKSGWITFHREPDTLRP